MVRPYVFVDKQMYDCTRLYGTVHYHSRILKPIMKSFTYVKTGITNYVVLVQSCTVPYPLSREKKLKSVLDVWVLFVLRNTVEFKLKYGN